MPSFLSKVFGRKKDDTKTDAQPQPRPSSDASLLEGKFEAVPKVSSPATPHFEVPPGSPKEKDRDAFGLFKSKSNRTPTEQPAAHGRALDWHLSLNLPGPKEESTRALGVVFEADPDAQILLPESVIAERRLSPLETFLLVQACSQKISAHGLETLGIMIPHWYSASPTVQRKLISLFIQSLALRSPITTLSPTASSPVSAFESEISTTRSPHDVAAVLRWGLRHLQLDGSSFGKDEQWYGQFLDAEKASEYPVRAYTEKLAPLLGSAHFHLLTATLEIISSLAAHAEANSISGSKLSKMLGLWLLAAPRVTEGDDCLSFYAQWEKWGRVLEHLFLARIRDEAADHRMPTRLMELVKHYPYAKSASSDADPAFLPSPRFSTRRYDALFVRIETEVPSTESQNALKNHPLRLIADALKASTKPPSTPDVTPNGHSSSEMDLWESLKKHVSVADADSESYPGLSSLFADETIRFLSLIPTSSDAETKASEPTPFTLFIPASKVGRRRSMSLGDPDVALAAVANAHAKAASTSTSDSRAPDTNSEGPFALDWGQFSTSGFFAETSGSKLASTLLDNKDVEVTIPRKLSARRKLPPALIPLPSSRGKSLDLPPPQEPEKEIKQGKSRATKFEIIQLDEAFIDFWSDALLDPISGDWPGFVVCKIKSSVPAVNAADSKRVGWLIIEQRFVTPRIPAQSVVTTPEKEVPAARPRPTSPKPSFASDSKSTKKKRFSFFTSLSSSSMSSTSTTKTDGTKGKKKAGKGPKVGEMGEILKEEEEPSASVSEKSGVSSAEVAAVATGAVAAGAAAAVATAAADTPKAEEPTAPTLVEDAVNTQVPPTPPTAVESPPVPDVTPSLPHVVTREPTPPPAVAEPEPGVIAREPTPAPDAVAELDTAPPVEEESPVEAEPEPEVAREPTPPPLVVAEPEPEAAPLPEVEEPIVETAPEPEAIVREPSPAPAPVVEDLTVQPEPEHEAAVEAAPEPEMATREPSPPPAVEDPIVEPEPEPAQEPEAAIVEAEPEPEVEEPVVAEPEVEEAVVEAEPEPEVEEPAVETAEVEHPIVETVPEPEVEEPIVEAEPEPEVVAREPSPPPASAVEDSIIEAEPEPEVEEPAVETAPEVVARAPSPPPAPAVEDHIVEPEPEPVVETAPEPEVEEAIAEAEPELEVEEPVAKTAPELEPEVEEPIVETAPEPQVDEPIVEAEPEPAVEEPLVETAPEPVVEEPIVEAESLQEPVIEAEPEPEVEEPVAETAPEPEVEEPIVEAEPVQEPVIETAPEPAVEEAVVKAEPEPAVEEPIVETAPEPEVEEPIVEAESLQEPVIEAEPEPEVEEPVAETAPEPEVEEPVVGTAPEPEVEAPIVEAEPEPEVEEPVVETAPEPDVEEPLVEAEPEPAVETAPEVAEPIVEGEPIEEPVIETAPEPEVEDPIVETAPEPEVVASLVESAPERRCEEPVVEAEP
ncbi:hypothetical protein DFH06DRAFT_993223 [Mycena polygramma]|nr:hypothetical protein DFH06DRAFT_993223 [Mycena polygramma]